ncbi:hypothetical protein [Ethanoligenens harbinense]|nr:hypothetical protein [Ethanoligenens harbinense]
MLHVFAVLMVALIYSGEIAVGWSNAASQNMPWNQPVKPTP